MPRYRFSKQVRLRKQAEIKAIFQEGAYRRAGLIGVKYLPTQMGYSRFVISIKKKVGNAPCRNRLKRLLREAIRLQYSELSGSYDICFFVTKPPLHPVSFAEVRDQINRLFASLNE